MAIGRLTPDAPFSLAAMGAVFDPLTATIGAISAFAASGTGAALGTAATLAGGAISAIGSLQAGEEAKTNADYQAVQMRQQGIQALASGQRQMFDAQRKTQLTQSTLQSNAAASGAGAQDATVINLGGGIAARGEEQSLTNLWNGQNQMDGLDDAAAAKEASGNAAVTGSYLSAAGTLLGTAGAGFGKYAARNPPPTSTPASSGWSSDYDINQVGSGW